MECVIVQLHILGEPSGMHLSLYNYTYWVNPMECVTVQLHILGEPSGMHLSLYNYTYGMTPGVVSWTKLQQPHHLLK